MATSKSPSKDGPGGHGKRQKLSEEALVKDDDDWIKFTIEAEDVELMDGNHTVVIHDGHASRVRIDTKGILPIHSHNQRVYTEDPNIMLYKSSTSIKFNSELVDVTTLTKSVEGDRCTIKVQKKPLAGDLRSLWLATYPKNDGDSKGGFVDGFLL